MALWEAYGDPNIPPFPEDIISLVTHVMVPPIVVASSLDEITHPDAHVATIDLVPTIDAPDSMQKETTCLPTSASWDDFLPDIAGLFMESHIEDVGDIIDVIRLLFVEETTSCIMEIDCDTSNNDLADLDMWGPIDGYKERSQH